MIWDIIEGYWLALRCPWGLTAKTAIVYSMGNLSSWPRHLRASNAIRKLQHAAFNPCNRIDVAWSDTALLRSLPLVLIAELLLLLPLLRGRLLPACRTR